MQYVGAQKPAWSESRTPGGAQAARPSLQQDKAPAKHSTMETLLTRYAGICNKSMKGQENLQQNVGRASCFHVRIWITSPSHGVQAKAVRQEA